ncbi:hypothetical protein F5146DRAFT_126568 [Armillaria mellea]|nr:hypothetical protein F5146DRAFT_126568 [Armillaria mellea]
MCFHTRRESQTVEFKGMIVLSFRTLNYMATSTHCRRQSALSSNRNDSIESPHVYRVFPARIRPCCLHRSQNFVLYLLTSPMSTRAALPRTHILEWTWELIAGSWLSIRFRSIRKHLRSIFTSTERPMGSAPLVSDQNANTIMGARPAVDTVGQIDVNGSNDGLEGYQADQQVEEEDSEDEGAKFTLSAFTETGRAESSIEVPKQHSYTGPRPVIPSSLADTSCAVLGFQGVLDQLNAILGKSETSHELHTMIEGFVEGNDDFGTAYARLRPVWDHHDPHNELCRHEEKDRERRQKALVGNQIVNPFLSPRRVWDLCSNRVVPFCVARKEFGSPFIELW